MKGNPMKALFNILLALFRPATAIDRAGTSVKWLWLPIVGILLVSAVAKASIGAPLEIEEAFSQFDAVQLEQGVTQVEDEGTVVEASPLEEMPVVEGELALDGGMMAIGHVAAVVFGSLGALFGVLYVATFFFLAAKVWANQAGYTVMLTVASLSLLPHAIRNFIQAAYMQVTGDFLAHPGLGALVAPATPLDPPGVAYALLAQIDIWVIWGLVILAAALFSKTIDFQKKQVIAVMVTFIAVTGIFGAVPSLVAGALLGGM